MFIEPSFNNIGHRGWIEVITGPMFSGKTEELIRRIKRASIANQKTIIFKPEIDTRFDEEKIVSHDKRNIASIAINKPIEIFEHVGQAKVIGIDEAQFFDLNLVEVTQQLALDGFRVIVAGLDMDYLGKPFPPVPQLLAVAEYITKVHAICVVCGSLATHSFRKIQHKSHILVGEKDAYEPKCRKCFYDGI